MLNAGETQNHKEGMKGRHGNCGRVVWTGKFPQKARDQPGMVTTDMRAYNPYTGRWESRRQEDDHKLLGYALRLHSKNQLQSRNRRNHTDNKHMVLGMGLLLSVLASFISL